MKKATSKFPIYPLLGKEICKNCRLLLCVTVYVNALIKNFVIKKFIPETSHIRWLETVQKEKSLVYIHHLKVQKSQLVSGSAENLKSNLN